MSLTTLLVLASATLALGQRPFFAGSKPIGYPVVTTTEGLGDRFGEVDGTTQRLPIEANGDRDLVDRLSKLPIDKQPFWLINWQALEANREKPQTYPQRPNPFVEPLPNGGSVNLNTANTNSGSNPSASSESSSASSEGSSASSESSSVDSKPANVNAGGPSDFVSSNRFGAEEYPKKQDKFEKSPKSNTNAQDASNVSSENNKAYVVA